MSVSPIVLNGTIQQTQNVLQNQTKETHKGMVDQGNIYVQEQKKEFQKARQVVRSDDTRFKEERYDAKEKGKSNYQGDGGKNRKHEDKEATSKSEVHSGFDVKV